MDYTREPIIETVITPKEGCKLVVRSSKSAGQEEYFVDAVEVVSFGHALFLRSIERPKAFLVPASDYEVLEVREARMVLKNVGIDRTIKIGGGRESREAREPNPKTAREPVQEPAMASAEPSSQPAAEGAETTEGKTGRLDKRRDKRRHHRRRRGRDEGGPAEEGATDEREAGEKEEGIPAESANGGAPAERAPNGSNGNGVTPPPFSSLLPPPPTLISETIARYRDNALFKDAFFVKDEEESSEIDPFGMPEAPASEESNDQSDGMLEALEMQNITLEPSAFGTFDNLEDERVDLEVEAEEEPSEAPQDTPNERLDFPK